MARSSFRRFLLVGGALAAAAAGAYIKRDRMRELLPGSSSPEPSYSPSAPPTPSNYDAPGPPANTATPVPAPEPVVTPEPSRFDPVEEQAIQADDPQAVEAAVDAAAADAAAEGIGSVDEPGLQGAPEPIDEQAEEQAAAAEAAAIGGSPGLGYAGSEVDESITEAERPLAEAGEGVSEGLEQAEAELEENATVGDGVSDAERQIDETIEAASNPAVGETPEAPADTSDPEADGSDDDDISGGDWQTWSGGAVKPQEGSVGGRMTADESTKDSRGTQGAKPAVRCSGGRPSDVDRFAPSTHATASRSATDVPSLPISPPAGRRRRPGRRRPPHEPPQPRAAPALLRGRPQGARPRCDP
jgi:hypothetical protein